MQQQEVSDCITRHKAADNLGACRFVFVKFNNPTNNDEVENSLLYWQSLWAKFNFFNDTHIKQLRDTCYNELIKIKNKSFINEIKLLCGSIWHTKVYSNK